VKSCKEVTELVSQSLDRRLSLREWMQLRMHLLMCDACSRFKRQAEFLHRAARDYARRGLAAAQQWTLSQSARQRIRAALQTER
jgi:Putative zinc-finger